MSKDKMIKDAVKVISKLPLDKVQEIADFADFLLKKYEDESIRQGIEKLTEESDSFSFLKEDEELYTIKDLKEKY
jgi:hypothetical protein